MGGQLNLRLPGTLLILLNLVGLYLAAVDFIALSADPPFKEKTLLWCPFEEECEKMKAESDADSFDWRRHQGPTPTWDTGPAKDHTTDSPKGYMLYTEASDGMPNDTDVYKSEPLTPSVEGGCLSFWYHLRGVHIGTISAMMNGVQIWHRTGPLDKNWYRAVVPLNTRPGEQFQVSFRAVRGSGEKGDIAIDDIHVVDASCPQLFEGPNLLKCDFEKVCPELAVEKNIDNYGWQRRQASTPTPETGPTGDHTNMDQTGHFIYAESSSAKTGDRAWIRTQPPLRQSAEAACLKFWYHMYGQGMGTLNVYMKSDDQINERRVFSKTYNQGNMWHQAKVDLNTSVNTDFYIQFEAIAGSGETSDIALDDIEIKTDKCETSTPSASSWSAWSQWSACSQTCGDSIRTQERKCSGTICSGEDQKSERCNVGPCLEITWGEWAEWTQCSATCGEATRSRVRSCSGGQGMCGREGEETDACLFRACPQIQPPRPPPPPSQGSWNSWEPWTECTVTCGTGFKSRQRTCTQNPCTGSNIESQICNTNSCTATPEWDNWTAWTACSVTCGDGTKSRVRECKKGSCVGNKEETVFCQEPACQATPEWDNWMAWNACSVTCGDGTKTRVRDCKKGSCVGNKEETVFCQEPACPAPRVTTSWNAWNPWGPCSATCGSAEKIRTRTCSGSGCPGSSSERGMCSVPACPQTRYGPPTPAPPTTSASLAKWSDWGNCDVTCGSGYKKRTRICLKGECEGNLFDTAGCATGLLCRNKRQVAVGTYGAWGAWSQCDATCGYGTSFRTRMCQGSNCIGGNSESRRCILTACQGCNLQLDLAIIVDSSGSIEDKGIGNWEIIKTFVNDLIQVIQVGPEATKVAVIKFSNGARVWFNLDRYKNQDDMFNAVLNMPYSGGETNTQLAINTMRTDVFSLSEGDRPDIPNACIIITDGESNIRETNTIPEANRAKQEGVNILTVGVTDEVNQREVEGMASKLDWVFRVNDFDRLPTILEGLMKQVCTVGKEEILSSWDAWGGCSRTCGPGVMTRSRRCIEGNCTSSLTETKACQIAPCTSGSVEGKWNAWGEWCDCSVTCGPGIVSRKRTCQTTGCQGTDRDTKTCYETDCITQAQWGPWTGWCPCTVTCGQGAQVRSRECRGSGCIGISRESRTCQDQPCGPSGWGAWASWTSCSRTCGQGTQERIRSCPTGQTCPGTSRETKQCQLTTCLPLVSWGAWNSWTRCSASCGRGTRTRSRTCSGQGCPGTSVETEPCDSGACPVSMWGAWLSWEQCSVTCGQGTRIRRRLCSGQGCPGSPTEIGTCSASPCPVVVPGQWNSWTPWAACSRSCGRGEQTRSRRCRSQNCAGANYETKNCVMRVCQGVWLNWATWGSCTCPGVQQRSRQCSGTACSGSRIMSRTCGITSCAAAVPGSWTPWAAWTRCNPTCGRGNQRRSRICTNENCVGADTELRVCVQPICQGAWSNWGSWGTCACPQGVEQRSRQCIGASACSGNRIMTRSCTCAGPNFGSWGAWQPWSACSVSCGGGRRSRLRSCQGSGQCQGNSREDATCSTNPCQPTAVWNNWSPWQPCSATCGSGTQRRERTCSSPGACSGISFESRFCSSGACPAVSQWSQWGSWGSCSVTCGNGQESATRYCMGGTNCQGESTITRACIRSPCVTPPRLSEWGSWGHCTATCGGGQEIRSRSCLTGNNCVGTTTESRPCNTEACEVNVWSGWGTWGPCSPTCGPGTRVRTNSCISGNCIGQDQRRTESCSQAPCDGLWGPWSAWSGCSSSCGQGTRTRTRRCVTGTDCRTGSSSQTERCGSAPCIVDVWQLWQPWTQCSATCGPGTQTRTRTCSQGQCVGQSETDNKPCNLQQCQVARWSDWSGWSQCSASCGGGQQTRQRRCLNGFNCIGSPTSGRTCNVVACIVSTWSDWSGWSQCSASCGGGQQTRQRRCLNGLNCPGSPTSSKTCNWAACIGLWGPWSAWSGCSSSCGQGTRTRTRRCVTGTDCTTGSSFQTVTCTSGPCPQWGNWGPWEACSASCGSGRQTRRRNCQGFGCVGDSTDSRNCQNPPCVVSIWGPWTPWTQCSATCGSGNSERRRSCNSGQCQGVNYERQACILRQCVGTWSNWGAWTPCNPTCGNNIQRSRTRVCQGTGCPGENRETGMCALPVCPAPAQWEPWTPWGTCSVSCGLGSRTRTRTCSRTGACTGQSMETMTCNNPCAIWGAWGAWGQCTVSCGSGTQTRSRLCATGNNCGSNNTGTRTCQMPFCIVAAWNPWTPWNNCPVTCGGGQQSRTRTCNGANCIGSRSESKLCNTQSCGPTTGIWTFWYPWSRCDVTCGTGRQTRTRLCPLGGCVGSYSSTRSCSSGPCAVVAGTWGPWGPYTECTSTCGGGTRTKTRACSNDIAGCGAGSSTASENCNTQPCIVTGTWSPWAPWSPCTSTCGGGMRSRTRTCNSVAGCGAGSNTITETCNTQTCPVAMWLGWSHWSLCSASCGAGTHTRSRSCSSPTGCRGVGTQNEVCFIQACAAAGGQWASWSGWSPCSVTCGNGIMNRVRVCAPSGASCTGGGDTETSYCTLPSCSGGSGCSWTQWGACSVTCGSGTRQRLSLGTGCVGPSQESCNMGPCTIAAVAGRKGAVNDIQSCGGSLSAGKYYKNLTSPGFGEDSGDPVNDKCTWTISAPEGHIVQMNMVELEIDCVEEIWSLGERLGGPFELHACGEKEKVNAVSRYATRGRTAVIVYRSVPNNRRLTGFKLHYKSVPLPQTCSEERKILSGKNGIIHSPNFHARTVYPVDNTCSWLITTQPGSIVELSFAEFDVTCDDHVIAYSGETEEKPIKGRVCSPQNITENMFLYSTTNKMLLAFVSRGHKVGRGFIAVYRGASPGSSLMLKKKASMTKAPTDVIEDGLERKLKELEHEWDYVADCGKLSRDGKIGKWHVTIRHNEKVICSGAILNSKWIVTTASCVFNRTSDRYLEARYLTVHVGLKQRSSNDTTSYVASVIGHPGFKKDTGEKDIALLKLKSALSFSSTIGPICLPGLLELETLRCKAVGFLGKDKTLSTLLMDVSTRKKCLSTHPDLKLAVTEGHLCIGNGTKFNGACVGDMGSSIVCDDYGRFHLQALSLWGGADCINRPPVYLNVGTYREWLKMYILQ